MSEVMHQGWADTRIATLYHEAERIADTLADGSTEKSLVLEAMSKLELADQYVEKRRREDQE